MKHTPIPSLHLVDLPTSFQVLLDGAAVYDSSCSETAQVYFIDRSLCARDRGQFYLKSAPAGALTREAVMGRYFYDLGMGTDIVDYTQSREHDWLLSRRVPGEDATHKAYLAEPKRLATRMGEILRVLHETPIEDCPGAGYLNEYLRRAEENYRTGNFDSSHFPDSFGYGSAEEAWNALEAGCNALRADTLIHGDYCLPNVILDGWAFSGFIDLGNSGIADRHIDLFWGAWSLSFNLGTDAYKNSFLDAYGRDRVDEGLLRVVAAAEVFG